MLDVLLSNIKKGKGKNLADWNRLLDKLKLSRQYYLRRFATYEIHQSGAQRLLYHLLYNIDTKYLFTLKDDVERYFKTIKFMDDLPQRYDVVKRKGPLDHIFYTEGDFVTKEIHVSTKVENITNMPFDLNFEEWQTSNVSPVEILADPADVPPEELIGDVIDRPDEHTPTYSIISINIALLVLKWLSYVEAHGENSMDDPNDFIHNHLIGPLWSQLTDQWILGVINDLAAQEPIDQVVEEHKPPWGIDNTFEQGVEDLQKNLISLVKDRKVDISDVVNTPLFLSGSFLDKVDHIHRFHFISDRRQYSYVKFLTHSPYIFPLLRLYYMRRETAESDRTVKELKKRMRKYERTKPQNVAYDQDVKDMVELMMQSISSFLIFM